MSLIKTKSFELATISRGDENLDKLAIVLPGRLDTKDYANNLSHLEYLANKGSFAVSFDPPGTWESPGPIELFTTTNYIQAVNEVIEYFGNKPTFVMGHSRGGTTSILAGTSNPIVKVFAAVMATYGAPSSATPEAQKVGIEISYRDLPPGTHKTSKQKEFSLPMNYFIDGAKYHPAEDLAKCTKPKLLFYGTNDEFTTVERIKEVFETIPEPKILHELDTDHDYRYYPEVIEEVNKVVGEFIDKYLT